MQDAKIDIRSMLPEELESVMAELGEPGYRAKQLFSWLSSGEDNFEEMTNLPKSLREKLSKHCTLRPLHMLRKQVSALDGTIKYLWQLEDGNAVETVVMRYHHGNTICISTQVGCRMGCAFCASTLGGLVRDLTPSEMLGEVLASERESGLTISNIVLMGIGEPLDNYSNVLRFLTLINHPKGRNIGMRHISLSTCGLVEGIDALAEEDLQLTLSLSLHAPDDETRSRLMPINRSVGLEKLMRACVRYYEKTKRRISFEYIMVDRVNDTLEHAKRLASLVKPIGGHVNLIPLNRVEERSLPPSPPERIAAFSRELEKLGVNVTVRRSLGGDVDASCGQLRRKTEIR